MANNDLPDDLVTTWEAPKEEVNNDLPHDLETTWEAPKTISQLSSEDNIKNGPGVELNPTASTLPKPMTKEEVDRMIEVQGTLDRYANAIPNAVQSVAEPVMNTMMMPANAVAAMAGRTNAAMGAALGMNGETSLGEIADQFLNPQFMKEYRRAGGAPETLEALLKQSVNSGLGDYLSVMAKELAPKVQATDVIGSANAGSPLGEMSGLAGDINNPINNLVINSLADPLMHIKVAQKIDPIYRNAAVGVDEAVDVKKLIEQYKNLAKGTGLGVEAERGERALLQFQFPGMPRPLIIRGEKTMQALDEMSVWAENKINVRPYLQDSRFGGFNAAVGMEELANATIPQKTEDAISAILTAGPLNEKTIRYASNVAEHGDEAGKLLSKRQGINLTPAELETATEQARAFQEINRAGNEAFIQAGGRDLDVRKLLTKEEQQKVLDRMKKKYGDIPALILQDGNVSYDLTFSGEGYDFGRSLTEEARKARKLQGAVDNLQAASKGSGISVTPNAARQRIELSTQVMNGILEREFGVAEAFNPNKAQVVIDSYRNKLEVANKLKLYNFTKKTYGVAAEEIPELIRGAKMRVDFAAAEGRAATREDLHLAMMTPTDFRPIDHNAFKKISAFQAGDDKTRFIEQNLFYPKDIADRVESRWLQPSRNQALAQLDWFQAQIAKARITGIPRMGKQAVENFFKSVSLGVPVENVVKEMSYLLPRTKKDAIARLADHLPSVSETMLDTADLPNKIKVSMKMLSDPEVQAGVDAFYQTMHQAAKEGAVNRVLQLEKFIEKWGNKAIGLPKLAVEAINDNAVTRTIRKVGNSSDGLLKRAYFRTLIERGYNAGEAAQMVGDHLMDFGKSTRAQQGMRYIMPFASFQLKNLETLAPMLALKPGVSNIVNPYSGYLKRAIEDANGWSPNDYKALRNANPYFRDPILGPVLRGSKTLVDNKDDSLAMVNRYAEWGLGDKVKDKMSAGFQMSLMIPNQMRTAVDLLDPTKANETFHSPLVAAAGVGLLGYDIMRGKPIDTKDTNLEALDRMVLMAREMNPLEYPKFYNQIMMPAIEKVMPDFKARLRDGPISRNMAKILKLQLGSGFPIDSLKIDEATVDAMTNLKFFGMVGLRNPDMTFLNQQLGLMATLNKEKSLIKGKITREGKEEMYRTLGAMKSTINDIKTNTKVYLDYKARFQQLGGHVDPAVNKQIQMYEGAAGDDDDVDEVPETPDIPADAVEIRREPQSVSRETSLMQRGGDLTRAHMPMDLSQDMSGGPRSVDDIDQMMGSQLPVEEHDQEPVQDLPRDRVDINDPGFQAQYQRLRQHGLEPEDAYRMAHGENQRSPASNTVKLDMGFLSDGMKSNKMSPTFSGVVAKMWAEKYRDTLAKHGNPPEGSKERDAIKDFIIKSYNNELDFNMRLQSVPKEDNIMKRSNGREIASVRGNEK